MERVIRFLTENSPFYLATINAGKPRLRPLGFACLHDGKLYFGVGKHKDVYKQVAATPAVEICAANPRSEWIRIHGNAVLDDNPAVLASAFEALPMLKDIYNETTGKQIGFFHIGDIQVEFKDVMGETVMRI